MKSAPQLLPFEVFQLIDSYLYKDERAECIKVCWNWYIVFKQLLHRDITIENQRQFDQFYRMINQGFNTLDDTGRHVKLIEFKPSPTYSQAYPRFIQQLRKLPMICPNIASLCIPNHVLRWDTPTDNGQILLPYASSLTDLKLCLLGSDIPDLTGMNSLKHICLTWPNGKLKMDHLERIHHHCKSLVSFEFSVKEINTSSFMQYPDNDNNCIADKITHFSLASQQHIDSVEPLFDYTTHTYPHLQYLGLKSTSPTSNKTDLEEEEEELDVGTALLNRYSIYAAFVRECPNIQTLAFDNILPDQVLLQAMSAMGIQLNQLDIKSVFGLTRSTYELMIRTAQHSVSSITLHSLLRIRNPTQALISTLRSCSKLRQLDLGCQPTVPVDLILDQCPQLVSLSLYDTMAILTTMDNGEAWVHPTRHLRLHNFSLDKVMFDNSLFDYLTRRCPRLVNLSLINSICSSSTQCVRIHMPASRLGQVNIERLFAGRYARKSDEQLTRVALSIIEREKAKELQCERPDFDAEVTRWYEAGRWHTASDSEAYGYLSICCQSIDRLFVNQAKLI